MTRTARRLAAALVALGLAAAGWVVVVRDGWRPPDRWNPFAPLTIAEAPGWFTAYKLSRIERDRGACLATLATGSFRFRAVPDRSPAPGCGFDNAVHIDRTAVALGSAFTLSCPAAVSLALWEQHVVQPAAERHLGERVARIDHLGSYACRNVYGRDHLPRSQHATANAVDIAGFVLTGGRRVAVLRDWTGADAARAAFWRDVRDGACLFFAGVLGPDYNAEHADHLHLDRGPWRACR